MKIITLTDRIRAYVSSIFFPISIALLAFLSWLISSPFLWIPVSFYLLLSFAPLVCEDGRGYIPLFLFLIITPNTPLSFSSIHPSYITLIATLLSSILLYLIIHRPKFIKDRTFFLILIFIALSFISYLNYSLQNGFHGSAGVLYLLTLLLISFIYAMLLCALGRNESMTYLIKTIAFFALTISIEVLVFCAKNGFVIDKENFNIGWSDTPITASTLLTLSLPFLTMLIQKKKFLWSIISIVDIASVMLLSTDSGFLALLIFFIPLILMGLKNIGKTYPYISLAVILLIISAIAIPMGFNEYFYNEVITAIRSLNFANEADPIRNMLFKSAAEMFVNNPVIGISVSAMVQGDHTVQLMSNSILTTVTFAGSLGLVFFVLYEVQIYFSCLRKDCSEKWLFFLFLLMFEFIGLLDNTLYNLAVFPFFLIAFSCYQMSTPPNGILVHESDYIQLKTAEKI